MRKRAISSLVIFAVGMPVLILGGIPYYLLVSALLLAAAWEYGTIFNAAHQHPSRLVLLGGTFVVTFVRTFFPEYSLPAFEIVVLIMLAFHLFQYEQGRDGAVVDFTINITGLVYIGWVGSYILDLRAIENGFWWFFIVFPCVWLADIGAYSIGSAYGRNKLAPRLSPKKTWEGYWAGVFTAVLAGVFFSYAFTTWGPLNLALWQGGLLGLLIGLLTPLGDLGESMFKRQIGMKDSGKIIPGHGGAFDRIDSWLWAAIIGYYFIMWFL